MECLILDGAMGTMLQNNGLQLGEKPEIFGMEHPDLLEKIHESYIQAGSNVILTNTFGANCKKLAGTGHSVEEVIKQNLETAKKAGKGQVKVALDIGPIGELLEPLGTLSFEEAYEVFKEVVVWGEKYGADLLYFETMTDLYEVKAGVLAAMENTSLPIWVTMSFEKNGRTFSGTKVECFANVMEHLPVEAIGINCSLGPKEIYPLIATMKEWTNKKIIVKPNAGLPDPETNEFPLSPAGFFEEMKAFEALSVDAIGGCCGTSPEYIKTLKDFCRKEPASGELKKQGICSSSQMVPFTGIHVIGERINPTGKKRFKQALIEHDMNYIMECAVAQQEAGAEILDINVGLPETDEVALMQDVVKAVQSVSDLPLQIDSSDPKAIEAGLRVCNGRAIVNSVNGDQDKLESILPIVKKYGGVVIGLTLDREGVPKNGEARFAIASRILETALAYGIPREDIWMDCLTLTVSAEQAQAKETLAAVRRVHDELKLHTVLGVSNISFGLPDRNQLTSVFLTAAFQEGLDFPILNPNLKEIMDTVHTYRVLSGEDEACETYISRFSQQKETKTEKVPVQQTIEHAILKGLREETAVISEQLLQEMSPMDLIQNKLIPALDIVGEKYEKGELFLPQLIAAANAATGGFEKVKKMIASGNTGEINRGTILMATVEGDIHDIGKNIVRVVLENYGYRVIDLGKDVPPEKVVETALKEQVKLVGLSALMTTTVPSMKKTIEALKEVKAPCKVMVGGAVLTADYAEKIGADFYSKDAKMSVDIAKKVFAE